MNCFQVVRRNSHKNHIPRPMQRNPFRKFFWEPIQRNIPTIHRRRERGCRIPVIPTIHHNDAADEAAAASMLSNPEQPHCLRFPNVCDHHRTTNLSEPWIRCYDLSGTTSSRNTTREPGGVMTPKFFGTRPVRSCGGIAGGFSRSFDRRAGRSLRRPQRSLDSE